MKILILKAPGTNRDYDVLNAFATLGGESEIVPLAALRPCPEKMRDYGILVVPGGFSYGDALGAGKLFALDLSRFFAEEVRRFVDSGKPVLGICNGFQALVKAGILPGLQGESSRVTLAHNERGTFECRWVRLAAPRSQSLWTEGIERLSCPVAHGEGRFVAENEETIERLARNGGIAFQYADETGEVAKGVYPCNPNGSVRDIAGICNQKGNVLGLMPHPENAVFAYEHFSMPRSEEEGARRLFSNGLHYATS